MKKLTTVLRDGWIVSVDYPSLGQYKLRVHKPYIYNGRKELFPGNADGKLFPTKEAAWQFALERGYLEIFSKPFALKEMIRREFVVWWPYFPQPFGKKQQRRERADQVTRMNFMNPSKRKIVIQHWLKFTGSKKPEGLKTEPFYRTGYWNVLQYNLDLERFLIDNKIDYYVTDQSFL